MKVLTVLICIILDANSVSANEIRTKRGLSADEQKKLVDEVNKDRQEMGKKLNIKMRDLTYDVNLEKTIKEDQNCGNSNGVSLKSNSVQDAYDEEWEKSYAYFEKHSSIVYFLNPNASKIACSKTYKCYTKIGEEFAKENPKFAGQSLDQNGVCIFDTLGTNDEQSAKITKAEPPSVSKYGDILGVAAPPEPSGKDGATDGQGSVGPSAGKDGKELVDSGSERVSNLIVSFVLVFFI